MQCYTTPYPTGRGRIAAAALEVGCDVRYGLKLTQEKKILMEQDKIKVDLGCVGGSLV